MDLLPNECIYEIFIYLNPTELMLCYQINNNFYNLIKLESLWKNKKSDQYTKYFNGKTDYETCKIFCQLTKLKKQLLIPYSIELLYFNKELRSNYLDLKKIPLGLTNLITLEHLDLEWNKIKTIPEIGQLTNLQRLNLRGNEINEIPLEIEKLIKLKYLSLDMNHLIKIPQEIGKLTSLKMFWLRNNYIKEISPDIGKLSNLEQLDLGLNSLREIPSTIGNLTNLINLDLSCNPLDSIPFEITKLKKLTYLGLDDEQINVTPEELKKKSFLHIRSSSRW